MNRLTCEMCNSTDVVKQEGMYICQSCGTKYSVEEAKKMMIEGTVEIQGTVKIDSSDELKNLYQIARRAKDDNNGENAAKYYDMILVKDPSSWEATFYVVYFKAMECKIAQIQSAGISVANCIDTVLKLIKDSISDKEEQKKAYTEVANRVMIIAIMLYNGAKNHYDGIDGQIRHNYLQEWLNNAFSAITCVYTLGDNLDLLFGSNADANNLSVSAWKQGVTWHQGLIGSLADKEGNRNTVNEYSSKIKKYDSTYTAPQESGACYVATAVYGSYDCPEVWTLRRYRDYSLDTTWCSRTFIKIYYAISPTIVKWFGKTEWFNKFWKSRLDKIVAKLKEKGYESTKYNDKY